MKQKQQNSFQGEFDNFTKQAPVAIGASIKSRKERVLPIPKLQLPIEQDNEVKEILDQSNVFEVKQQKFQIEFDHYEGTSNQGFKFCQRGIDHSYYNSSNIHLNVQQHVNQSKISLKLPPDQPSNQNTLKWGPLFNEYKFDDEEFYEPEEQMTKNNQQYWFESEIEVYELSSDHETDKSSVISKANSTESQKSKNMEENEKIFFQDFYVNIDISSQCSELNLMPRQKTKEYQSMWNFRIEIADMKNDYYFEQVIVEKPIASSTQSDQCNEKSLKSDGGSSINLSNEQESIIFLSQSSGSDCVEVGQRSLKQRKEKARKRQKNGGKSLKKSYSVNERKELQDKKRRKQNKKILKEKSKEILRLIKHNLQGKNEGKENKQFDVMIESSLSNEDSIIEIFNAQQNNNICIPQPFKRFECNRVKQKAIQSYLRQSQNCQQKQSPKQSNKMLKNGNIQTQTDVQTKKLEIVKLFPNNFNKNKPISKEILIGDEILSFFKRPQKLQEILQNQSGQRSQIVSSLLLNSHYFKNLYSRIPLPPKIPLSFGNVQEYQRVMIANQKSEVYTSIRQTFRQIHDSFGNQSHALKNSSFLFKIFIEKQQKNERNLMYELSARVVQQQSTRNVYSKKMKGPLNNAYNLLLSKSYKSKYRLFGMRLLNKHGQGSFVVCQIKDMRKMTDQQMGKQVKQIHMKLIVGLDFKEIMDLSDKDDVTEDVVMIPSKCFYGDNNCDSIDKNVRKDDYIGRCLYFYDIGKVSTQSREYDSILNIKNSFLSPFIISPNQIRSINMLKTSVFLRHFNSSLTHNLDMLNDKIKHYFNHLQMDAITQICRSDTGIDLLQGPPGTGKTSTLIGIVSCEYLKIEKYNKALAIRDKEKNDAKNKNRVGRVGVSGDRLIPEMVGNINNYDLKTNTYYENGGDWNKTKKETFDHNVLKILICTPSNAAIDLIASKILNEGLFSLERSKLKVGCLLGDGDGGLFRKFPNILRIGVQEEQICQEISNNYMKNNEQKQQEQLLSYIGIHNYSLFSILNKLFATEMNLHHMSINKKEIHHKIRQVSAEIQTIKSLCLEENNRINSGFQSQRSAIHKNWLHLINNTIHVKSVAIEAMQDFISKPPQLIKNQPYSAEVYFLKQLMKHIEKFLIAESEIILTTLASSCSQKIVLCNPTFSCVIIDEAGQSLEATSLIPFQYGMKKAIMIGDQCQLPPTIQNVQLFKTHFNRSLFERLWQNVQSNGVQQISSPTINSFKIRTFTLCVQYRMNPLIRQFPSKTFYRDKLFDSDLVIARQLNSDYEQKFGMSLKEVAFIDCQNGIEEMNGNSFYNRMEGQLIIGIVYKIYQHLIQKSYQLQKRQEKQITIGVITPYSQQQRFINKNLELKIERLTNQLKFHTGFKSVSQVTVSTVDSYQGQERDIIIISTVRSNFKGNVGFVQDQRRINVALTRAKQSVIVVGNSTTLDNNSIWKNYLDWVSENGTYLKYQGNNNDNASMESFLDSIFCQNRKKPNQIDNKATQNVCITPLYLSGNEKIVQQIEQKINASLIAGGGSLWNAENNCYSDMVEEIGNCNMKKGCLERNNLIIPYQYEKGDSFEY